MIKVTAEMSREGEKFIHALAVAFHYPTPAMTNGPRMRAKEVIISQRVIETEY